MRRNIYNLSLSCNSVITLWSVILLSKYCRQKSELIQLKVNLLNHHAVTNVDSWGKPCPICKN